MTQSENLFQWQRVKTLVNALQMEKSYGCGLSPYAVVLLNNLSTLVNEEVLKQKELLYESSNPN